MLEDEGRIIRTEFKVGRRKYETVELPGWRGTIHQAAGQYSAVKRVGELNYVLKNAGRFLANLEKDKMIVTSCDYYLWWGRTSEWVGIYCAIPNKYCFSCPLDNDGKPRLSNLRSNWMTIVNSPKEKWNNNCLLLCRI